MSVWNQIWSLQGLAVALAVGLICIVVAVWINRSEKSRDKAERSENEEIRRIVAHCAQPRYQNIASLIQCGATGVSSNRILIAACKAVEAQTGNNPMAQAYSEGVVETQALSFLKFIAPTIRHQLTSGQLDYANHNWLHKWVEEFKSA